jgi:DNA-binding PadR family transcriptional regulator
VRREIQARTARDVAVSAVHAALDRLEARGLVVGFMSGPTPERGGRAKRSFHLTGAAIEAVNRARTEFTDLVGRRTRLELQMKFHFIGRFAELMKPRIISSAKQTGGRSRAVEIHD